ncbi:MAG: 30S ribosomal protein S27ae [Candidatus Odinarchaeia archaeon]
MSVHKYYKIEGDKLVRLKKSCPRCGPGTFMAEHSNRFSCGKCGWTVFKKEEK